MMRNQYVPTRKFFSIFWQQKTVYLIGLIVTIGLVTVSTVYASLRGQNGRTPEKGNSYAKILAESLVASSMLICPADTTAYWKLDETSGSTYVDSFDAHDANCTLNCPSPVTGLVNGAQEFDGNATDLNIPADPAFDWGAEDSFSIEFWMKGTPEQTCGGSSEVVIGRDDNDTGLQWWLGCDRNSDGARFQLHDTTGDGVTLTGPKVVDGEWHHIVGARDGAIDTNYLYVDGALVSSAIHDYTGDFSGSPTTAPTIGWFNHKSQGAHFFFEGIADEIAIYSRALPADEVQQHYDGGLSGQTYCNDLTLDTVGMGSATATPDITGRVVTVTAASDPGWFFAQWSGDLTGSNNPDTLTMDSSKVVTATFTQEYTLDINIVGNGGVSKDPDQATYAFNDVVTLTATAGPGWSFAGWSGDLSGATNPATLTITGNHVVTATFTSTQDTYYIFLPLVLTGP